MNKNNLLQALKLCKTALGAEALVPGVDHFHFKTRQVTAYNGSLTISASLDFDLPVEGSIYGDTFFKLINGVGEEIELILSDPNTLLVKSGRSKTSFAVNHPDVSYLDDLAEDETQINLPTNVLFASGLKRCMLSLGKESTEAGVFVFVEDNECRMYSTNKMTYSRFVFPVENASDVQVFLPAAFIEQLLSLYSQLNKEPSEIKVTNKYARALFDTVSLRGSFYAAPINTELRQLVDDSIEEVPVVEVTPAFREAISLSEVVAKDFITIDFGIDESLVKVTASSNKGSQFLEEVELPFPMAGSLTVDVRNVKRVLDSSNQVGFTDNFMLLQGTDGYHDYLINAKIGN